MTLRTIKAGAQPNDGGGDNLRAGAQIINENFAELDQRAVQASAQLKSIETGATKNRPDAELLDRANHTGVDKRVIVSAGSIDDVKTPGLYAVFGPNSTALPGAPVLDGVPRVNAILDVLTIGKPEGDPLYTLRQIWRAPGKGGQVWERGHAADGWGAWRMVLMQGDFGLGAKADATFQGANLNPDTYRTGGYVVGQFNISPHGLVTGVLITQAGSNTTVCSQQFYDWANGRQYSRAMQSASWSAWKAAVYAGDYGLGATSLLACNDANNVEASGDLLVHPGTLNGPNPGVYGTIRTTFYEKSSSNWTQLILSTTGNKMFYRGCINGGIQPWMQVNEEFITNANGSAIKFSDGTMICWGGGSTLQTTSNQVAPGIFLGNAEILTFPIPFASIGGVTASVAYSANAYCWGAVGEGNNPTQCRVIGISHAANAQYYARYTAVGRWR
ncbi:hypothetical protein [Pseudomonas piscis]